MTLPPNGWDGRTCSIARLTSGAKRYCGFISQKAFNMKILQELISLRGEGRLTYSQEGSLVSHFQRQESEGERKMTVTSGRKCFGQYGRYNPLGSLVRTLLESPAWYNPAVRLRWKVKPLCLKRLTRKRYSSKNTLSRPSAEILSVRDIPSSRFLFQLAVSERRTGGTGYGSLLPTVQTQGLKVCDKDGKTRFMDLSSLPKQGIKYGDLLPTPVASDYTGSCTIRKMTKSNGAPRTDSLRNMPAVIGMDGDQFNGRVFQLSPLFVEEMMGYPLMWTTLPFLTENGEKNP